MLHPRSLLPLVLVVAACGGSKDEPRDKAPAAEARNDPPEAAKVEAARLAMKPRQAIVVSPGAPAADPATFAPVDLSAVPALGATIKAPPGATVTPDDVGFNETAPDGAVVAAGAFKVHLRRGTIGGEREAMRITLGDMRGGTYTETRNAITVVEYSATLDGTTTYGFFEAIKGLDAGGEQLICGNAEPAATVEALAPYRAACASVTKAK